MRVDPRSAEAGNNLGAGYGAMHQWARAIAAEQQALKLAPALQIAQNNLRWFSAQGDGASVPSGSDVPPISSVVAEAVNLSLALNREARYPESMAAAQRALALDPRSAEAWNNIAADQSAMHHWDEAVDAARKALAIKPDFQLARNNLAWAMSQKSAAAGH